MPDDYSTKAPGKLFNRKVAGIPIVYLFAGLAVVVAYAAWRAKATPTPKANDTAAVSESSLDAPAEAYPTSVVGSGTVIPQSPQNPYVPAGTGANSSITTNDEWLSKGVTYLIQRDLATPGEAQRALAAYLEGEDLTYEQGRMRDAVIREYGIPPAPARVGQTADAPPRMQGAIPREHIVRSRTEDTAGELAALYYGDAALGSAITGENGGRSSYAVGESVHIPARPSGPPAQTVPAPSPATPAPTPNPAPAPAGRTYTVVRGDTLSGIGARYGVSWQRIYDANRAIIGANPNLIYPGQVLRIP